MFRPKDNLFVEQYRQFVAAIRFLSSIPWPGSATLFHPEQLGERLIVGGSYFPLVGLLIGLLLSLLVFLLRFAASPLLLAALLTVGQVLLTGGLHLDGLMDSCDGFFGGVGRERKLEIMKDSRVGSFGVLGALCVLLLRIACFASLRTQLLPQALLLILPAGRWCMVLAMLTFPGARATGLGNVFRQAVTKKDLLIACCTSLGIALLLGQVAGLLVWLVMSLLALGIGMRVTRTLGGLTGDIYGAIEEASEVIGLLVLALLWH